jgi:HlyD family secretion protein
MNTRQDFPWLPVVLGGLCIILFIFQRSTKHVESDAAFYTEKAQSRNIASIVNAKGILIPEEIIKIGNLINGIVRYLYVDDNDFVQEGQLLAEVDDSLEDSGVNSAFGNLDAAQAILKYQWEFLKRQEQLYECKQISLDAYQQAERDYQESLAKVENAKSLYQTAKLIYDNKRIHSPISGFVIAKRASVSEAISNYPPESILYFLAKDIKHLNACILLDDKQLATLRTDITAHMTIIAYPHQTFSGAITAIGNVPNVMQSPDYIYAKLLPVTTVQLYPCAMVPVENHDLALRPGMTFNARIVVDQKENALTIPQQAFDINLKTIEQLVHQLGYTYQPLSSSAILQYAHENPRAVWVVEHKTFIQKLVSTGISDGDFVEITKGLDGSEDVVCIINEGHSIIQGFKSYFRA